MAVVFLFFDVIIIPMKPKKKPRGRNGGRPPLIPGQTRIRISATVSPRTFDFLQKSGKSVYKKASEILDNTALTETEEK